MKRRDSPARLYAAGLILAAALAGCGNASSGARRASTSHAPSAPQFLGDEGAANIQFGWIKSITRLGRGYKLVFNLGMILSGATGVQACVDNGQCPKYERHNLGFPDDIGAANLHFVVPYYLPPAASVTLFDPRPLPSTTRELYLLYHGRDPRHLIERDGSGPLKDFFGWWIKPRPFAGGGPTSDPLTPVVEIQQQWHP